MLLHRAEGALPCAQEIFRTACERDNEGVRPEATANQAVLALARAIEATFTRGDWLELGLITDSDEVIRGHRRLLRSLEWGDEDYSGNILDVLPKVLGERSGPRVGRRAAERFPNLGSVEEQVGLREWLAANDRELYHELYGGGATGVLDELQEAADRLGIPDIDMHAVRIRRGLHIDPAQAIGSAKELLETTLKAILGLHGTGPETKLEIPQLVKQAGIKLGLDAGTVPDVQPGAAQRRRVLGSLAQIVHNTAELRNAGLGTGHGVSQGPVLDVPTARLVVSAAVAVATFYAEAFMALESESKSAKRSPEIPF